LAEKGLAALVDWDSPPVGGRRGRADWRPPPAAAAVEAVAAGA